MTGVMEGMAQRLVAVEGVVVKGVVWTMEVVVRKVVGVVCNVR